MLSCATRVLLDMPKIREVLNVLLTKFNFSSQPAQPVTCTADMGDPTDVEAYVTSLKVVELKDELKKRHLSYVGNKPALAQRLREDMLKGLQMTAGQTAQGESEAGEEGVQEHAEEPADESAHEVR